MSNRHQPPRYNASNTPCDAWYGGGFCSCGAFHTEAERQQEESKALIVKSIAEMLRQVKEKP